MSEWFGINYPFNGGIQNILSKQIGTRIIKNDLLQLFFTNPGERVYRSDYGVGIRLYLFDQLDDNSAGNIKDRIRSQVERFEPRVSIDQLNVIQNKDNNTLNIHAVFFLSQSPDEIFTIDLNLPILEEA